MAYVLGFFSADGYITVNKRGGQFWCIQITDKKLLEKIRKAVGAEHKISVRVPSKKGEKTLYRLQIGSIQMCDDLRVLGFDKNKTKSLSIPNVPDEYLADFVRGYFDGDGNVWVGENHKYRNSKKSSFTIQTVFTSCSHEFLTQLQLKLVTVGINNGAIYKSKGDYSRLKFSVSGSLKLYKFMYNRHIRGFSGLFLNRKKKVFETFMSLRS